jgi:hypothetical protein
MSKVYKNGIVSPKGFDMSAPEPVDQREILEFYTDLSTLNHAYPGIEVKIKEKIDSVGIKKHTGNLKKGVAKDPISNGLGLALAVDAIGAGGGLMAMGTAMGPAGTPFIVISTKLDIFFFSGFDILIF